MAMIPTTFDNHPAFDDLTSAFEAMDRAGIQAAMRTLNGAATTPEERQALGEIGAQALQRLGMVVLDDLPADVNRDAVAAWTAGVATDLLALGAFVDGSPDQQVDGQDEDHESTWVWPIELASSNRNWALVKVLLAHGADPMVYSVEGEDEDTQRVHDRSVIRAMLAEPTPSVALDLLGSVLDLDAVRPRTNGFHPFRRLTLHGLANHPTWTLPERVQVIRQVAVQCPDLGGDPSGKDLLAAVANGHLEDVHVHLLLGDSIGYTTIKELRAPTGLLTGRRLTVAGGSMHEGYTLLHAAVHALKGAASDRRRSIVGLLLDHGAAVNAATSLGVTPLHLAAQQGDAPTVRALLDHGANGLLTDVDGASPLLWAQQAGQARVVALLLEQEQAALRSVLPGVDPAGAGPGALARPRL